MSKVRYVVQRRWNIYRSMPWHDIFETESRDRAIKEFEDSSRVLSNELLLRVIKRTESVIGKPRKGSLSQPYASRSEG